MKFARLEYVLLAACALIAPAASSPINQQDWIATWTATTQEVEVANLAPLPFASPETYKTNI
jgi:hypothetical protein